jgi:hypothetical protein
VSFWNGDELSGNLIDHVGAHNLTDGNTVTYAAGPGEDNASMVDGDPIQRLVSKDVGAYEFVQTTAAKKPTWDESNADLNNRPTIVFDGTDDLLQYVSNLTTATSGTLFFVTRPSAVHAAASDTVLASADEASANDVLQVGHHYVAATPNALVYSLAAAAGTGVRGSTEVTADANQLFTFQSSGTAWTMRRNGAAETLTVIAGSNTGNWFGDSANRDNVTLGALVYNSGSGEGYMQGALAEVLVYDSVLSAADIAAVESYLARRYGIAL